MIDWYFLYIRYYFLLFIVDWY